jgi:hypothetical protein
LCYMSKAQDIPRNFKSFYYQGSLYINSSIWIFCIKSFRSKFQIIVLNCSIMFFFCLCFFELSGDPTIW